MKPISNFQCAPTILSDVTPAILAGGRGTRMGFPKAQLRLGGMPILEWMHRHYQWPGPTMLVTAPAVTDPPAADLFDQYMVDPVDDLGPLRGIVTALESASTEFVAIVTVDMPGITRDILNWMLNMLAARPESSGLMCKRRVEEREFIEPFPGVFRRIAKEVVNRRLQSGDLSVQRLCDQTTIGSAASPEDWPDSIWTNLNHPAELAAFVAGIQEVGDRHEA